MRLVGGLHSHLIGTLTRGDADTDTHGMIYEDSEKMAIYKPMGEASGEAIPADAWSQMLRCLKHGGEICLHCLCPIPGPCGRHGVLSYGSSANHYPSSLLWFINKCLWNCGIREKTRRALISSFQKYLPLVGPSAGLRADRDGKRPFLPPWRPNVLGRACDQGTTTHRCARVEQGWERSRVIWRKGGYSVWVLSGRFTRR